MSDDMFNPATYALLVNLGIPGSERGRAEDYGYLRLVTSYRLNVLSNTF